MSSTQTEPTTIRHKIGTCPACRSAVWADVQVATVVYEPHLDIDGKAHVSARPQFLGMTTTHRCERNEEGDWERADG